jgi:CheY-like chemotaxis protein
MRRVMICEDDPLIAMVLAQEVADAGSHVVGAFQSGIDAWNALDRLRPEIAIVDLRLADGDSGLQLAAHLVERGCRVIVVSGSTRVHPELARLEHSFVSKPVLPGIIGELTGSRQMCHSLTSTEQC